MQAMDQQKGLHFCLRKDSLNLVTGYKRSVELKGGNSNAAVKNWRFECDA